MAGYTARANAGLNLAKKSAIVVGGTQGIGSGIALRLAQAGASVCIVGRNKALGDQLLLKMEDAHPKHPNDPDMANFQFVQADLSRVEGMKTAVKDLQSRGPVDYLFQCQGTPPTFTYEENADGLENRFATIILSKFALLKGFTEANLLKQAAVSICAPGTGRTDLDPSDPMLKQGNKFGLLSSAARDGAVLDALCLTLADKHPDLRFCHLFPGYVFTNAPANSNRPFPIPQLANLAGPILGRTVGNTPESYANIPVFCGANPEAKEKLETGFVNFLCQSRQPSQWATNEGNRDKLWATLSGMLQ